MKLKLFFLVQIFLFQIIFCFSEFEASKSPVSVCSINIVDSYYESNNKISQFVISSDGNTAFYATGGNKVQILDVNLNKESDTISRKATITLTDNKITITGVSLSQNGQFLYVSALNDGFFIYDVSDPTKPEISSSSDSIKAHDSVLSHDEKRVYISNGAGNIQAYDLALKKISNAAVSCEVKASFILTKNDENMFIADDADGMRIYQVKDTPFVLKSRFRTKEDLRQLKLNKDESLAFLAVINGGLEIVNISQISKPTLISQYSSKNMKVKYVELSNDDNKAAISLGADGISLIDVSNPSKPKFMAQKSLSNNDIFQIHWSEKNPNLLFAASSSTFYALDVSSCLNNSLISTTTSTSTTDQIISTTSSITTTTNNEDNLTSSSSTSSTNLFTSSGGFLVTAGNSDDSFVDAEQDSRSAVLAILVVLSVSLVGVGMYATIHFLKKRREQSYQRLENEIPMQDLGAVRLE